jgi:hypothetical protein
MKKPVERNDEMVVNELTTEEGAVCIIGTTPLVFNSMSAKSKQGLLLPAPKGNRASLESKLKHDVMQEFHDSPYQSEHEGDPTLLIFPAGGAKQAIANAAKDIPGATKAEIGRLLWIEERDIPIFGIPELYMAVVRNSDINRTPDIRTRAIVPRWAARFRVRYVRPKLSIHTVTNLLGAAGLLCGIGDGRQQKGALNFGQFEVVDPSNEAFQDLITNGGRAAQEKAMNDPAYYDAETRKLFEWYKDEVERRGMDKPKLASLKRSA